ncbi:calcium-binding protein [Streptomyces sp. NPDC047097]|uniref:calcium-binding protein n=1 Tax=Streptomyces sp. NPDC047097 TaxID=3155260 RepID=UPI0034094660
MRTHRTIATATTLAATLASALALSLAPAALAAPAAAPSAPLAATASVLHQDGELRYQAAPGQQNQLTVDEKIEQRTEFASFYVLTFHDRFDITIHPDAATWDECVHPVPGDRTTVRCAVGIPQNSDDSDDYVVELGDKDDSAVLGADSHAWARVSGGPGNDTIKGSDTAVFFGDDGNDRLDGGGGGPLSLGPHGGAGDDTLTRCGQDCFGGPGNDSLTGTGEENTLHGEDGDDTLRGGGGADVLYGGKGNDRLYGEAGNDTLWGNSGDDILWGGPGTDRLSGGPGRNQVHQD